MICSTIIPTIGRTTLSRAVTSVLDQDFDHDEIEVIVVNDSGKPLEQEEWMNSRCIRILHTNRHNRSVARNTGAAVAQGRYLHFLDDDDWMMPGAFRRLWQAARTNQAGWVYGGFHLVDNAGKIISEIFPGYAGNCFIQMVASEWIPIQASWIDSEVFFAVGGFASLHSLAGGYEDIDLSRMIAHSHAFTHSPVCVTNIRAGDLGSTTNYNNMIEQNRHSREKSLDMPGAFERLRSSAGSDPDRAAYWYGRIAYYYLASIRWNLKRGRVSKAASRTFFSLISFLGSGHFLLSRTFWQGLNQPHFNHVRVSLEDARADLYRNTVWRK